METTEDEDEETAEIQAWSPAQWAGHVAGWIGIGLAIPVAIAGMFAVLVAVFWVVTGLLLS